MTRVIGIRSRPIFENSLKRNSPIVFALNVQKSFIPGVIPKE